MASTRLCPHWGRRKSWPVLEELSVERVWNAVPENSRLAGGSNPGRRNSVAADWYDDTHYLRKRDSHRAAHDIHLDVMSHLPPTRWKVSQWMRALARGAADFVYPPLCRLCTDELPASTGEPAGSSFCEGCRKELLVTHGRACLRCGASRSVPISISAALLTYSAVTSGLHSERVIRLGVWRRGANERACGSKIAAWKPLASGAGGAQLLWECESAALQDAKVDVVVPVPQHWFRRIYRPHHAADTLASVWSSRLQVPLARHILSKRRWTRPQARLSPSERRENLRDAFRAFSSAGLSGAAVLLADDVATTGMTAHETAKVLTKAGAARVVPGGCRLGAWDAGKSCLGRTVGGRTDLQPSVKRISIARCPTFRQVLLAPADEQAPRISFCEAWPLRCPRC